MLVDFKASTCQVHGAPMDLFSVRTRAILVLELCELCHRIVQPPGASLQGDRIHGTDGELGHVSFLLSDRFF